MTTIPIIAPREICYGVCCSRHASCARYHHVNNAPAFSPARATCVEGFPPEKHGGYPLFQPVEAVAA